MGPRADAKSTLRAVPTLEFASYFTLALACLGAWAYAACAVARGTLAVTPAAALGLSLAAGFGPVVVAYLLTKPLPAAATKVKTDADPAVDNGGAAADSWVATLLHHALGHLFCTVPIAWACYLAIAPAA